MGSGMSTERRDELQAEFEKNVNRDTVVEEKKLRDMIRSINLKHKNEYESAVLKNEAEVRAESQKSLQLLDEALKKLEDRKQKNQDCLEQWNATLAKQGNDIKQELRNEGEAQVERKQYELHQKSECLERIQNELKEKRNEFLASVKEENEKRKKLQEEHDEYTETKIKEHREQLQKDQEKLHTFVVGIKNDQKKLVEDERDKQLEMLNEQRALNEKRLNSVHKLIKADEGDNENLDFKAECDNILVLYGRFSKAHNDEQRNIRRSISDMEQGEKLKHAPQPDDTMKALNNFCERAQSVQQNLPEEYQFLTPAFSEIQAKKQKIEESTEGIQKSIREYKKALKTATTQPGIIVNLELPKKHFEELKTSVKELDELVLKFNIAPSNRFHAAIEDTMKSTASWKQAQITGSEKSKSQLKQIQN